MISGCIRFSGSNIPFLSRNIYSGSGDISFHPAEIESFSGGCYLNRRLPLKEEDHYYRDDAGELIVLMSGSIYNRRDFLAGGDSNSRKADPELVAGLFTDKGPGFVSGLNGDFVIFIYRPAAKEAFLYRDHLGIRPVAWYARDGLMAFSMNITDLCRHAGRMADRPASPDTEYLLGYFKFIDYRRTPDARVRKLLPGHYLRFTESGPHLVRYWEPEKVRIDRGLTYDALIPELRELTEDAVRIRCDNRYNPGAHVSSGLDSGTVSYLARRNYAGQDPFYGFSWSPGDFVPADTERDERKLIRLACESAGITPVFSGLDANRFRRLAQDFYNNQGYISEAETVEQAVHRGVNLMFTGWGGDEFVSIGHSGIDLDLIAGCRFGVLFRRLKGMKPRRAIRHLLFFVVYPVLGILDPGAARGFEQDVRYIRKPFRKSDRAAIRNFYFHRSRRQMHLNVLRFYNIPERCESWYNQGFARGVEYRHPLLDRRIVEFMLRVPSELLCRTGLFRPLLRETGRGMLPEEIRLNEDKDDPVYRKYYDELVRSAALLFAGEADRWRSNPDLQFADFNLLLRDTKLFTKHEPGVDERVLSRTLLYLAGINEFTRRYREDG